MKYNSIEVSPPPIEGFVPPIDQVEAEVYFEVVRILNNEREKITMGLERIKRLEKVKNLLESNQD